MGVRGGEGKVRAGEGKSGFVRSKFGGGSLSDARTRSILVWRSIVTIRPVVAMNTPSPAGRSPSAAVARMAVNKETVSITNVFGQFDGRFIGLHYKYSAAVERQTLTTLYITRIRLS